MASFYDTTVGQRVEFQHVLASAGFTDEHIARIVKQPSLACAMLASIQPKSVLQIPVTINSVIRVERQLARYEEAGFDITDEQRRRILAQAATFMPLSATDRPLITGFFGYTPEAFNQVWSRVELDGYSIVRYFNQDVPLRFAPGMKPSVIEPRLVHFGPNTYWGDSSESALKQATKDKVRLAGIEVAEMLFVEPEWALVWNGTDYPYPNCSALRLGTDWSRVPSLERWDSSRQLGLSGLLADLRFGLWSSPSVREC